MPVKELVTDRNVENVRLIKLYRETEDEEVKEEFFRNNWRLATYTANKFTNTGIPEDERQSACFYGMLKAFNTFDPDKDIKFATYASRCMDNEVLMYLRSHARQGQTGSLEDTIARDWEGNELTLQDITEDPESSYDLEKLIDQEGLRILLQEVPKLLTEQEQVIFANMTSDTRLTQKELAGKLKLSQSYVSRLETRIGKKAKKLANKLGLLEDVLEPRLPKTLSINTEEQKELVAMQEKTKFEQVKDELRRNRLLTPREIADKTGVSINTVRTYMMQARKDIADEMNSKIQDTTKKDVDTAQEALLETTDTPKSNWAQDIRKKVAVKPVDPPKEEDTPPVDDAKIERAVKVFKKEIEQGRQRAQAEPEDQASSMRIYVTDANSQMIMNLLQMVHNSVADDGKYTINITMHKER